MITSAPQFKVTRSRGMGLDTTTLALGALLCLAVGAAAATQVVAHAFGYHPNLGPPMARANPVEAWCGVVLFVAIGVAGAVAKRGMGLVAVSAAGALVCFAAALGPMYAPTEFFRWVRDYNDHPELLGILTRGWVALVVGAGGVCVAGTALLARTGETSVSTSHGSAAWGSGARLAMTEEESEEFWSRRLAEKPGTLTSLVIGKLGDGRLLLYRGEGHLITTAMTRSGKGVGCVIPNALLYAGSMVINDVKAENFFVTHRKRTEMGQPVYVLDGFGVTTRMRGVEKVSKPYLASVNPLDMIHYKSDDALDVARMIAGMIIPDDEGPNRHFSDEAKGIYAGFLIYACYNFQEKPSERTLPGVRRMMSKGGEEFEELLQAMAACESPEARTAANELLAKEARERSGVISTINRHTRFLDSPAMERVLGYSDRMFDISTLKGDPVTVYLVTPPERLEEYAGWVRVVIACCNAAMADPDKPRPEIDVVLMVDEAGQLGAVDPLKRTMTLMAGFGLRAWLIYQNVPQMKKIYPKDYDAFYGSAEVRIMFGTGDMTTGELVSKYAGETTIFVEGGNTGLSRGYGKERSSQRSSGENVSEKGRALLMKDEVTRLGPQQQLVFITGEDPLLVDKARYFECPEFDGDHDENPLRAPPSAPMEDPDPPVTSANSMLEVMANSPPVRLARSLLERLQR